MASVRTSDVVIAGAGIIGLSLGLELRRRGLSVVILERDRAMRGASWAAGGMLAGHDPVNPPLLRLLALRSLELYPPYLDRVQSLSSEQVPLRTRRTLLEHSPESGSDLEQATFEEAAQFVPGLEPSSREFVWLQEDSLDPRDLCRALPKAFMSAGGVLLEETESLSLRTTNAGIAVTTSQGEVAAENFVNCSGAWAGNSIFGDVPVVPVKGQMLNVALAPERLQCVVRTPDFYAIPRGDGRVTVGATVEQAGFDTTVRPAQIAQLLAAAARVLPELATALILDQWAGLRPGTPDSLPILGAAHKGRCWHATGHYRDGILLAPATACVMAQAILGETTDVSLQDFSPTRFQFASVESAGAFGDSHASL